MAAPESNLIRFSSPRAGRNSRGRQYLDVARPRGFEPLTFASGGQENQDFLMCVNL